MDNSKSAQLAELMDELYVELFEAASNKEEFVQSWILALTEQAVYRAKALHPKLYKIYMANVTTGIYDADRDAQQKALSERNAEIIEVNKFKSVRRHV